MGGFVAVVGAVLVTVFLASAMHDEEIERFRAWRKRQGWE